MTTQLQYSCLGNLTDRRAWQATVHGVTKELDMTWWLNNNTNILDKDLSEKKTHKIPALTEFTYFGENKHAVSKYINRLYNIEVINYMKNNKTILVIEKEGSLSSVVCLGESSLSRCRTCPEQVPIGSERRVDITVGVKSMIQRYEWAGGAIRWDKALSGEGRRWTWGWTVVRGQIKGLWIPGKACGLCLNWNGSFCRIWRW